VSLLNGSGLAEKVLKGDEKSAARLISLIENGKPEGYAELSLLLPHTGSAHVIGITGPPGAGKSTITGRLAVSLFNQGKKVGVVATDPTSLRSGGAFLADRLRMKDAEKKGIFIRSMAHRGYPGGVARAAAGAIYVLEGLGKDVVLIESVGAGQAEKELLHLCDTVIILFTPDYGDEVQLMKAGLIEIGDILVVNKGDHPGAVDAERELAMHCSGRAGTDDWVAPVLITRADRGEGVPELIEAIDRHWHFIMEDGRRGKKKGEKISAFIMGLLKEEVWRRFSSVIENNEECVHIAEDAKHGKIDPYSAVEKILERTGITGSKGN
jgi:LAO/AO transport system kinase